MTTLQVKKLVTLTGVVNWREWLDYIGSKLELATWNAIKSGDKPFLLAEPRKPLLIDFNPDATEKLLGKPTLTIWRMRS
ncbi:hypothetical protein QQS21_007436 [Conoideocrella luteorostrata]|uniref:Uncharacterized protein n=1 Tax=Conoideocrella luteorostrata TaxID=1105319 RepID=A0AAJ0CKQ9_9HYPO|nr:hypothetical protein QQS21_007436 [Conoideocrella luteorostrata]